AAPRCPASSAETRASSSTNGPRAVLMRYAPFFIFWKTWALNRPRVVGSNGAWMETKSEISSKRSKLTLSTPAPVTACCDAYGSCATTRGRNVDVVDAEAETADGLATRQLPQQIAR